MIAEKPNHKHRTMTITTERKDLLDHPDDLRSDGERILRTFLCSPEARLQVLHALQLEPGLRLDVENGCIHMGEFDLVPFDSKRVYGLGRREMACVGWLGIGGVHIPGGRWEPDDYDEVEEARSDYSLPELVRSLLLLRYDRELGHRAEFDRDCNTCQGTGCVDPLAERTSDCPKCDGSGLSAAAQQALEKFSNITPA